MRYPSIRSSRAARSAAGRSPLSTVLMVLAAVATTMSPAPARAQSSAEVQQAREHFKRGDQAFKADRFEEAYKEWESGYKLSGRPLFLLNMAHAERRRGELAGARTLYKKYLLMEPTTDLRGEVEQVLAEIDSALGAAHTPGEETAAALPGGNAGPAFDPTMTPPVAPAPAPAGGPPSLLAPSSADAELAASAPPIYRRWWFWAGVGTVVAAGALTAVLLSRGRDYTDRGSLGTIGMAR